MPGSKPQYDPKRKYPAWDGKWVILVGNCFVHPKPVDPALKKENKELARTNKHLFLHIVLGTTR